MNDVSKLYQLVINREIQVAKNSVLDTHRIYGKCLAFLQCVSDVGAIAHVYTFWEKSHEIHHGELVDAYIEGLTMLMGIGYELRIDAIKSYEEIPDPASLEQQMFKIYEDVLKIQKTFDPLSFQDALDDYFHFGFSLGLSTEDILSQY